MQSNISTIHYLNRKVPLVTRYPVKLEVGCGDEKHRKVGFVGLDIKDYGQEYIWNLEEGIPLPDNSCEAVYTSHCLEHFQNHQIVDIMNEFHRILLPDCEVHIIVPYMEHEKAFIPTHLTHFGPKYWEIFTYESYERDYGIKVWKMNELIINERKDMHVNLTPVKDEH